MLGAVLKQQKDLSRDLVGGDFAKWHIHKAVPKQAEGSFRASRDGAEVTLLIGLAAAKQRHLNDVGRSNIEKVIHGK